MTIHTNLGADAFVRRLADSVPRPLRGWADDAQLVAGAREFLAPLSERLDDRELSEAFFGYCPVAGACAEDYRTRTLTLDGFGQVWAGIRFKGGDMSQPFIEVAADFALSPEAIAQLQPMLTSVFAVFRPRALRAWRFEADGLPPWPASELDQTYYVAPLARVLAGDRPAPPTAFRVTRATHLDWYDTLAADFADYQAAHPSLADEIRFETRDDLEACLEAGLLFEAHAGATLAGVIAFDREPFFGLPGFLVREEFLLAPFRGRGLGTWLQRLAAEQLPADHVLFGTIHALNMPSRRTAATNGRVPLLSSHFVPLP
jgi:GNAT superfamily N-acetyltransferase